MDAGEMSRRLASNALAVAEMLLPQGRKRGHEFCAGSVNGDPGESLKVCITGNKAGVWADFATGEGGDLLDLWQKARGLTFVSMLDQVRDHLGVTRERFHALPRKQYAPPAKPQCTKPVDSVLKYLTEDRKLLPETIAAFSIGEKGRDIVFPYLLGGKLIRWKTIGIDRDEKGKKRIASSKDSEPILFGWQAVPEDARYIVITEGEIDAMTVYQYGHPALSVPLGGGAGNKQQWVDCEYERLERFREVFLCLDNDQAGFEATREIATRLGAHRCRLVSLDFEGAKDANDLLMLGIGKAYFDACLETAAHIDPEELKNAAEFADQVERLLETQADPANHITLPWPKTHGVLMLEAGQLTIWSGFNGHGKSEMLLQVMTHRMAHGERVCIASLEVPAAKLIGRHLLPMATAMIDPSYAYRQTVYQWLGERLWLFNLVGSAKADRLLEVFEYAYRRYGVLHFVVDSLLKVGLAEDDYNGQKRFVEQLCDFKNATGACVHLVAHARKRDEGEYQAPKKHDVRGSGSITDLADNLLSVYRNKSKEDALSEDPDDGEELVIKGKKVLASEVKAWPDAYLNCLKYREGGVEPSFRLWFDRASKQFLESPTVGPKRYVQFSGGQNVSA